MGCGGKCRQRKILRRASKKPHIIMYNDTIENSNSATHLGITRNTNGKPNIDEKISLGRKTAYSLMGAGFHGGGGLKPSQNGHIWSTFIFHCSKVTLWVRGITTQ